ncbi:DNA topoisomerase I, mitochondrial [Heterocephalus glaber]|uniref:DNA topoisomerase n=1 Tax=Heterocephalus glaber TaxID=10181 RepID=G5AWG0_HETGA|nr:DNA topoisomerase I, mitochondrial [Heterocephalus glaber]
MKAGVLLGLRRAVRLRLRNIPRRWASETKPKAGGAGWEEKRSKDRVKWRQLEHRGPYFAPGYEPLPEGVRASFVTELTVEERCLIKHLDKCDFTEIHRHFVDKAVAWRALPREEKQVGLLGALCKEWKWLVGKLKEEAEKLEQEFGYCILDGYLEKIGNFKAEPPGLFCGCGDHPKMGMLKRRIRPEDVVINCSKCADQAARLSWRDSKIPEPPAGHQWKEVRSDKTVTWLAAWTENVQNSIKYIMLNPSSKLKLALRTGNEKEEGETADTVGCCSLQVEHVRLHVDANGHKHVFQNLQLFMKNKEPGDDLFDKLTKQLRVVTRAEDSIATKILAYNRANRVVAIYRGHQQAIPKTFEKSMRNLRTKIQAKKTQVAEAQGELRKAEVDHRIKGDGKSTSILEKKQRLLRKLEEQLVHLSTRAIDKEENKQVALGASKLNYLDPRISTAWCERFGVPMEKIYNKTQREKFAWALDMAAVRQLVLQEVGAEVESVATLHSRRASRPCEPGSAGRTRTVRGRRRRSTLTALKGLLPSVDAVVLAEERLRLKVRPQSQQAKSRSPVRTLVLQEVGALTEGLAALPAGIRMGSLPGAFCGAGGRCSCGRSALEGPLSCMHSLVPDEVEALAEGLAALLAHVGPLSAVAPLVPDHMRTVDEGFPTVIAREWLLPQVRALGFITSEEHLKLWPPVSHRYPTAGQGIWVWVEMAELKKAELNNG